MMSGVGFEDVPWYKTRPKPSFSATWKSPRSD